MRCQVRPFHLRIRHRVPVPGHGHQLRRSPRRRLTGGRVEPGAPAGLADQISAVTVGQRPGHERPGPVTAGYPPADLERLPAGPAPDREDPDIERKHDNPPLEMTGNPTIPAPPQEERPGSICRCRNRGHALPCQLVPARSDPATAARRPPPAANLARVAEPPPAGLSRPPSPARNDRRQANIATQCNHRRDASSGKTHRSNTDGYEVGGPVGRSRPYQQGSGLSWRSYSRCTCRAEAMFSGRPELGRA